MSFPICPRRIRIPRIRLNTESDLMTEPLIRMQKVKKVFVTDEVETHALEDIDLEIERGEYVSISGPSGCGKSTLLAILGTCSIRRRGALITC